MVAGSANTRAVATACLALAVAYYLGVEIGISFTLADNAVSLIWPPNAILLAALLLSRPRDWGWLAAAVFPTHLFVQLSGGVPLAMALCWYVSNLAEALLGACLIRALLQRTPQFDFVRDASVYLLCAGFVAPVVSSFLDAAFVAWVGWRYEGDYWAVWRMRLFSNALAAITVVPLIISLWKTDLRSWWEDVRARGFEAMILLLLLGVTSWLVFHRNYPLGEAATYVYAPLPLLVWAAVRLGVGGVASCIAVVAMVSISGEMHGEGPFSRADPEAAVLSLQIFLIIAASSLMLLAASMCELKQARATALRRKESLDLALSAARMGVWEWDVNAERFTWQIAAQDAPSTASTAELLQRIHPDDQQVVAAAMRRVRDGEDVGELECRFVHGHTVRWIMGKGKYLHRVDLRSRRVIGVWMDVTQSKRREGRERSQREQLAHLSRVAMLGEISGALTHELSQPLATILFNAEAALRMLQNDKPDLPEVTATLSDIVAADTHAAGVIRRLRTWFKRGPVQTELVDVGECIHAVLALEHSDLIVRGIASTVHIDREIPLVSADAVQIQQVLLNLIVNACEAMSARPTGERRLRLDVGREGEDRVYVSVSDTGCGVEDLEKVFEPFFTTKTHGIGLGLAISRTIIAAHGGRLWATNNPGGGATFHVSFAAATAENSALAEC